MNLHYYYRKLISTSFTLKTHNQQQNLYKTHVLFSTSIPKRPSSVPTADYLINRHGFSPETAAKASTVVETIRRPENCDHLLAFLGETGFTKTHLETLVRNNPMVLSSDVEKTIKPKIKVFLDSGFPPSDVADIVATYPWILKRSADKQLYPSIHLLKGLLGSNSGIFKVLKGTDWFLNHDLEKTMVPNIKYLMSCGICKDQIVRTLHNFPRFFICRLEAIKGIVERVDEMGYDRESKMYLHAIRALSSMSRESWELKLQLFRSLGWSENDILSTFRKMPAVFTLSDRKIKDAVEFVVSTGKYDISYLIDRPGLLIYSLEGRIKPRVQVVEVLKRKKLISKVPSLLTISQMTELQFIEKYVRPYLDEVGKLYNIEARLKLTALHIGVE